MCVVFLGFPLILADEAAVVLVSPTRLALAWMQADTRAASGPVL